MVELRRLNNIKNIAETERMRQREGSPMSVLLKMSTYTLVRGFSKKKIVFFLNLCLLEERSSRHIE